MFRGTCGDYRVLSTTAHGLRVLRAPGIPLHPLLSGRTVDAQLGRIAPRDREAALTVVIVREIFSPGTWPTPETSLTLLPADPFFARRDPAVFGTLVGIADAAVTGQIDQNLRWRRWLSVS